MTLNCAVRSNTPSPSSRYSQLSAPIKAADSTPVFPKPQILNLVSRAVPGPKIPRPPPTNAHSTSLPQPRASVTHYPPLLLTSHWRCRRTGCGANNAVVTSTHFTQLRHKSAPRGMMYWVPSYRLSYCVECEHQACEWCLLRQVESQAHWTSLKD